MISVLTGACQQSTKLEEEREMHRREVAMRKKELELKETELVLRSQEIEHLKHEIEGLSKVKEPNISELYRLLKGSVFTVYTIDDDERVTQGSAFVIDPTGIAVSNLHVFENASDAIAVNEIGERFQISEVLEFDEKLDYFIFRLSPSNTKFQYLNVANDLPDVGQECFAISNPRGLSYTLSKGLVSSYRNNYEWIQTDAVFTHGSSGAPLFNNSGEVIGITTSGYEGENLNFALNIQKIPYRRILDAVKYEVQSDPVVSVVNSRSEALKFVLNYFSILKNEEYWKLENIYAEELERYYNKYNIGQNWVIQDVRNYKTKFRINTVEYRIDEETILTYRVSQGIVISLEMDYILDREQRNLPATYHLKLFIKINYQGRIVSIYENILDRY